MVLYQFGCEKLGGALFWTPHKALHFVHPTLITQAQSLPPYYYTDYPWSAYLGGNTRQNKEDPFLCSSQPAMFRWWFMQHWDANFMDTWTRTHVDQITIQNDRLSATCIEPSYFQGRSRWSSHRESSRRGMRPSTSPSMRRISFWSSTNSMH